MTKTSMTAAVLAVTATGLVTALMATGSVGSASAQGKRHGHTTTVTFIDRVDVNSNTDIDLGEPGFSVGDQQIFRDRLMRKGHRVGISTGVAQLTATSNSGLTGQVVSTVLLKNGSLTLQSAFTEVFADGPAPVRFAAITGGTEAYRGASGQCRAKTLSDGDDAKVTCKILVP